MKFSLAVGFSVLAAIGRALPSIPVLGLYDELLNRCNTGDPDVYVGVLYGDDTFTTFSYGKCYPYILNGENAVMAVFCRSVTCFNNPNPDCTGGAVPPVPVPILAGLTLVDVDDWVLLLGQGATCQMNNLPNLLG
jgi:hypothetical protein